jgi:hypothetical protein
VLKCPLIGSWNKQEAEIEYVEGYDELEEEDDIEDFGIFQLPSLLRIMTMVKVSLDTYC